MTDIFCKIINDSQPESFVYRDLEVVAIKDIHPQAPVHLLIMPVKHFSGLGEFSENDGPILAKMLRLAHRLAQDLDLDQGYRLIINEGEHGGKMVQHLHLHLLGGKSLGPKLIRE